VSVLHHREWDPERRWSVTLGSKWTRDGEPGTWVVVDLWKYEQGPGRHVYAVTIECKALAGWPHRHMSQARLVGTFREVGS
jgi:hypothetical protein